MSNENSDAMPDIDHIVVVMFENRSFDNLLAWPYSHIKPKHFIPDGSPHVYMGLQKQPLERLANPVTVEGVKYELPPTRGFSSVRSYLRSPPFDPHEEFEYVTEQVYGPCSEKNCGWTDGNVPAGREPTMKGFASNYLDALKDKLGSSEKITKADVAKVMETGDWDDAYPFGVLALASAVCDAWFASVPTQTDPNRAFMAAGSSNGAVNNSAYAIEDYPMDTVWNRLMDCPECTKNSWKIYWENTFPPGEYTMPWTRRSFRKIRDLSDEYFPRMAAFHRDARLGKLPFFSFLEPSWTLQKYQWPLGVQGLQGNDTHPPGDVRPGLQFLSGVVASLLSNQQAWQKTLLLVTFDEHGGTWDHVAPPSGVVPPDIAHWKKQKAGEASGFRFDRLGPRVPTILMSPLVKPGTVFRSTKKPDETFSYPYDHTSIPATVLKLAGLPREKWNLGDRVAAAPTFEGVLTGRGCGGLELDFGELEDVPEEVPKQAVDPVRFGQRFVLMCADDGPFKGWFMGPSGSAAPKDGENLGLTDHFGNALRFRLGMGYDPTDTKRPSDMMVRAPGVVYLQYAMDDQVDAQNSRYVRVKQRSITVGSVAVFGEDDGWWYSQWYIREQGKRFPAQGIPWGSIIQLAYQALDSTQHWLPRKMVARHTVDDDGHAGNWVAVGSDTDWENDAVGNWQIVQA